MNKEILSAILGKLAKGNPNLLNDLVKDLSDKDKALIFSEIDKYPADIDLNTLKELEQVRARYMLRGTEYYLQEREPIPYIVKDLIAESSISLWYGQFGSKKTWTLLDLAVCIASGKEWLGFTVNPCRVLIVDEESGERRLADRLKEIMRGELVDANIPLQSVSLAQFNLRDSQEDLLSLIELIDLTGAKLVIIDALADVMLGGDENSVKDTQPVFAGLRKASEVTGASFIVIHHSNKLGGYRGSSAIAGAIDNMLLVQSKPESDLITFKSEKVRDGIPMDFAGQAIWSESGFYMKPADSQEKEFLSAGEKYVIRYLTQVGGQASVTDIKNNADTCEPVTARKAVYSLASKGYICRVDDNSSGMPAIYGFTEKGRDKTNAI